MVFSNGQSVMAYFDGFGIELEAVLGNQEFLNIFALITLELNDLSHLTVGYNGTIAGKLLLDDLEDLLLVEFLGQALDGSQSLATIALLNADVDVVLALLLLVRALVFVGLRKGVCTRN